MFWAMLVIWASFPLATAKAQPCEIDATFNIYSNDETNIWINVAGLNFEDLGVNQALCGVEIFFEHTRLANIRIELISPAGQSVTLIGPGELNASPTGLINWDLYFLPCAAPTVPDAGLSDVWDNGQAFQLFTTYSGFYHPNNGCLEDFNMGSANGWWQIKITDLGEFGVGEIDHISLIFCDDTGISCDECSTYSGILDNSGIELCEGDPTIINAADLYLQLPDTSNVDNQALFLIWQGGILIDTMEVLQLQNLNPGTYTICGINIALADANVLTNGISIPNLDAMIADRMICAEITEDCIPLDIFSTTQIVSNDFVLCEEGRINFMGFDFDESIDTTIYTSDFATSACVQHDISIVASDINVDAIVSGQINCDGGEILINALNSSSSQGPIIDYIWTTTDGNYIINQGPIAQVNMNGDYFLTVDDGFCKDSILINIDRVDTSEAFDLELSADSINCDLDPVNILVNTIADIDSFEWNGPGLIQPISLNPFVNLAGQYELLAFANGCQQTTQVEVFLTEFNPAINFDITPSNCSNDTSFVEVTTDVNNAIVNIEGPGPVDLVDGTFIILEEGSYSIIVQSEAMVCADTIDIEVDQLIAFPWLDVLIDTLSLPCGNSALVIPAVIIAPNDAFALWEGPSSFSSDLIQPSVSEIGWYYLTVTDPTSFCESYDSIYISETNLQGPLISLPDSIAFDCNDQNNIILDPLLDPSLYTFEWNGPGITNFNGPVLSIPPTEGIFILVVTDQITDCQSMASTTVYSEGSIDVSIIDNGFDCNTMSRNLCYLPVVGDPSWYLDGVFLSNLDCIEASISGTYSVELSLDNSGCTARDSLQLEALGNIEVVLEIKDESCAGLEDGAILITDVIGANGSISASINGDEIGLNGIDDLAAGDYELTVIDQDGCSWSQIITINPSTSSFMVSLPDTIFAEENTIIEITAISSEDISTLQSSMAWVGNGSFSCIACQSTMFTPNAEGMVCFTAQNDQACEAKAQTFIVFSSNDNVYIPNSFSPNGDLNNDVFGVAITDDIVKINLSVYDRWGNLVFDAKDKTPDDPLAQWNGDFNGKEMEAGVFVYLINIELKDGTSFNRKGSITLIK